MDTCELDRHQVLALCTAASSFLIVSGKLTEMGDVAKDKLAMSLARLIAWQELNPLPPSRMNEGATVAVIEAIEILAEQIER